MINQPILIVEDDKDDRELIQSALLDIGVQNEQKCFPNGLAALEYLKTTPQKPFLIISDINMPLLDGFALKKHINSIPDLDKQAIPFVLVTTSKSEEHIDSAYQLSVQGFFSKPDDYKVWMEILKKVIDYWLIAKTPTRPE